MSHVQVTSLLRPGFTVNIGGISTLTRQTLCALLDRQDPMGRDWCLLALKMGLVEKMPKLDKQSLVAGIGGSVKRQSQTAKLLDESEQTSNATIGK